MRSYCNVHAVLAVILNIIIGNRSKSNVIYDRPLPLDISLLCIVLARRPWLHYGFPPSQNTIDVFFVADMGLFYQRNEPQDPYITYRVSHVKLDLFSRFYSILTKYNWCILCCWHGHLLSKKWATRPLHYLQGVPCQIGSFFLDFILSWQNTIDVFFVTDMGIFYQNNEPHDPCITYSVSNIQLYLTSSVNKTTVESRVLTRITNSEINFLSKGHSTYGSKIPFISNLKKPACASKWDVLEFATLR